MSDTKAALEWFDGYLLGPDGGYIWHPKHAATVAAMAKRTEEAERTAEVQAERDRYRTALKETIALVRRFYEAEGYKADVARTVVEMNERALAGATLSLLGAGPTPAPRYVTLDELRPVLEALRWAAAPMRSKSSVPEPNPIDALLGRKS